MEAPGIVRGLSLERGGGMVCREILQRVFASSWQSLVKHRPLLLEVVVDDV